MDESHTFGRSIVSELAKKDRCTVCGNTRNLHEYDGDHYCKNHLNQKLAME